MKKGVLLFLVGTLLTQLAQAQIIDSLWGSTRYDSSDYAFSIKWERLFENVNTSKITTGFFMNKAVNFINPSKHTGNLTHDNETHVETMNSLHTALRMAQVTPSVVLKDSTEVLWDTAEHYLSQNIVPIGAMFMSYSRFREDIFERDLIAFNASDTTLRMGSDTTQSAFVETTFFIAAPYKNELVQGVHQFALPSGLYLSNLGSDGTLANATLKFGNMDGEYTIYPNQIISIDFTNVSVGDTWFTLKVCFTNGKCLYAKTRFRFLEKMGPPSVYSNRMNDIYLAPTVNDFGGTITIALGCGKTELTKPLIIAEAFDPKNSITYENVISQLTEGGNVQVSQILREFEAQGYDLVYLNYTNGGDDITRNAEFFRRALIHINTFKHANGSTEPNAVLGISMGALVAKLGLRSMELASQDHETDLYMSLDGPHKGAYMPHSLLQMLAHFKNLSKRKAFGEYWFPMPKEAADAITLLSCTAAKQMIVGNVFDPDYTANSEGVLTGGLNNIFYAVYSGLGNLAYCREVALTNGSISQKDQQYPSALSYAFMPDNLLLGSLGGYTGTFAPIMQTTYFDFKMFGLPNRLANVQFYKGRIDAEVYVGLPWLVEFNLTNYDLRTKAINTLSYDNAPGGYLAISQFGNLKTAGKGLGATVNIPIDQFCFVPTTSSLAVGTDNLRYDILTHSTNSAITLSGTTYNYYRPTYSTPLFKQYSAPAPGSAISNYWNEAHSQPSPQSAVALGYELLAPAKGQSALIDEIIFRRDSIVKVLAANFPWLPLEDILDSVARTYYMALNYGYKRISDKDDIMCSSGNTIHRSIDFPGYVKLHVNSNYYVVSPTLNNPPVLIDTSFSLFGFPVTLNNFPTSLGRQFITDANSSFTLSTAGAGCGTAPINVTMKKNSELQLGSAIGNRTGILNINNQATVRFEEGSSLKMYNRSHIIVRSGSTLEIDLNVPVLLNDTGCYIELEPGATLRMLNNRIFNPTGNGYIRIRGGEMGQNVNIIGKVSLSGAGKTDKILELKAFNSIIGPTVVKRIINIPDDMTELQITDGRVESNCELTINAETVISNTYLDNHIYNFNNTLESTSNDWLANLNCFEDTKIIGGTIGGELYAANIIEPGKQLEVNGVVFNGIETEGLEVYNCNTDIRNSAFLDNDYPMQFEGMTTFTELKQITINTDDEYGVLGRGIKYFGGTGSSLHLERCNVLNQNLSGIILENAPMSVLCSKVTTDNEYNNANAINLQESSSLILDPSIFSQGAGKCDLSGYYTTIYATDAEDIQINNGLSNLEAYALDAFTGIINKDYSPGLNYFYANDNYWKWGGLPDRINHYYYFYYKTPSPYVPGTFETRQFGISGNGDVNAWTYLITPPNISTLCPLDGAGGGGMDKKQSYEMNNPTIVSGYDIQYNSKYNLKDIAAEVYHPDFVKKSGQEKLNQCASIILNNYKSQEANAKPIVKMVYQKMMSTLGEEMHKGSISFNQVSSESETLLQAQNHLLANYNMNEEEKYAILMDKALTLRIQGKYTEALALLSDVKSNKLHLNNHTAFINKWECQLKNEKLFYSGIITNNQFKQLIEECKQYDSIPTAKPKKSISLTLPEVKQNVLETDEVKSYPNPTTDVLNIEWTSGIKVSAIRLVTIEGKVVFEKIISNHADQTMITLSTQELSSGFYFLEFTANKKLTPQKITIHK